jgi:glycosyltransferase involved in cell wall biosynthesis
VIAVLSDPARRARMSAAARELVVRRFDLATQTRELERIYDAVRAR